MATQATPAPGTSTQSTLSEWAGPYVTGMLGKAQAIADQPYQTYQGPMTAGESALQSNVFKGLGSLAFPSNLGKSFTSTGAPDISGAMTGTATGTPTGPAAAYMNPYLEAVLSPQLAELRRQSQITQMGNAAKATGAGAFGGSRQALMDAETQRNLMQEMNKTVGTGYANAYDKAMQQFNTEQQQAKTLSDMMMQAGGTQRDIEQQGITADYNEFLAQRDYPMKMTQYLQSMLQGLPISTVSTSPASQTGIGQLASTVGTLGTTYDLLKKLGVV